MPIQKKGKQEEKHKTHIKTPDFYSFYADTYFREVEKDKVRGKINRDTKFFIEYKVYCTVIDEFNKAIRDLILYKSFDFNMPSRLGVLGIRKRKLTPWFNEDGKLINPLPIDWKTTQDLWEGDPTAKEQKKLVRHYNAHTKGYVAKWYYSKRIATYKWKSAYAFIPCRTAKSELGKILKDPTSDVDYYLL
jgi:hypothetical protein